MNDRVCAMYAETFVIPRIPQIRDIIESGPSRTPHSLNVI